MKILHLVDVSQQDENGEPIRTVLATFEIDALGLIVPPPDSEELQGVLTEEQLRDHYAYSSFAHIEDAEPVPELPALLPG